MRLSGPHTCVEVRVHLWSMCALTCMQARSAHKHSRSLIVSRVQQVPRRQGNRTSRRVGVEQLPSRPGHRCCALSPVPSFSVFSVSTFMHPPDVPSLRECIQIGHGSDFVCSHRTAEADKLRSRCDKNRDGKVDAPHCAHGLARSTRDACSTATVVRCGCHPHLTAPATHRTAPQHNRSPRSAVLALSDSLTRLHLAHIYGTTRWIGKSSTTTTIRSMGYARTHSYMSSRTHTCVRAYLRACSAHRIPSCTAVSVSLYVQSF